MAASGGMLEVDLGKVAKQKALDGEVRKFADKMVADHTKANQQLADMAKAAGYTVPTKMMPKHQELLDKFKTDPTKSLDRDYIKLMVKDHEDDVEMFDRATREAKHADLKAFAAKLLPTLKDHLQMAKRIDDAFPKK
jgi:putative membrane protein